MYSQNGEDDIVAQIFSDQPPNGRDSGIVLEIGAWGVRDFSNSRLLIERGWSAVLCEFSPKPVRELVEEYGNNERVQIIQAAITVHDQHCIRMRMTDDALSTSDEVRAKLWSNKGMGGFYGYLYVRSLTLDALIEQFFGDRKPDFVSIDTEGTSVDLAIHLLKSSWAPDVLCVEHDGRLIELAGVYQDLGYHVVHTNAENLIVSRI